MKRFSFLLFMTLCFEFLLAQNDNQPMTLADSLNLPTPKEAWVDPVTAVPVNSHYVLYPTNQRGQGTEGSFVIYLPEEYQTSMRRYPVVYYLHGGTGSQREGHWMIERIDKAIKEGRMNPVIVVCPQAMPIGWYINGNMQDPKVTTGPIEDVLIRDLIPYVDSHYRTIAGREGRALEGFSMGGRGTLRLAFEYPGIFCAASSVAGAVVHWEEEPMVRALECTFGSVDNPASKAYFDARLPEVSARKNAAKIVSSGMKVRMFVGTADRLYNENGNHITQRFSDFLDSLGIAHTLEIVPDATHDPQKLFKAGRKEYDVNFWDQVFERGDR